MAELAEDKLCGLSCSWCGTYFEKEHGYPVLCRHCYREAIKEYKKAGIIYEKFGLVRTHKKEL